MTRNLHFFGAVIGVILLTVAAAILSGGPILFPDSVGYFHAGLSAMSHWPQSPHHSGSLQVSPWPLVAEERDGISTARSVYYGLFYTFAFKIGGPWALPLVQAIISAAAIVLAIKRGAGCAGWRGAALTVLIALATGLSVFAAAAMPDVFAGLMLLAVAMITTFSGEMPLPEYIFWLSVVLVSGLFHRGHVAVLVLVLAVCQFTVLGRKTRQIAMLAGLAAIALVCHIAVDLVVKDLSGRWPIQTPFLLARFVGDGTAKPFLEARCSTKHYELCRFVDRMPMSENEFLWGNARRSVMGSATRVERERIAAEAQSIEFGIISAYPIREAGITLKNFWSQLFDVGVAAYQQGPTLEEDKPITPLHTVIVGYLHRNTDRAAAFLQLQSSVMFGAYIIALVGCMRVLFLRSRSVLDYPGARLVSVLFVGLAANALIFGAVSGVFDRYQGRLAWLPVLGMAILYSKRRTETITEGPTVAV